MTQEGCGGGELFRGSIQRNLDYESILEANQKGVRGVDVLKDANMLLQI